MTHQSPQDQFTSADDFLNTCWTLSNGLTGVTYKKSVLANHEAFVILEWETETGRFVGAEYVRIVNEKIVEVIVVNNSPDLAKTLQLTGTNEQ